MAAKEKKEKKAERGAATRKRSDQDRRDRLRKLSGRRHGSDVVRRGGDRGYSLEGLRLVTLLNQLQALQAVQGLAEFKPKDRARNRRFQFSEDRAERAAQEQWLTLKADWLEALLEDTLDEIEALLEFEERLEAAPEERGEEELD